MTRGFTLIELIVVTGIMVVLTGGGLAVFSAFRSTRIAKGEAVIITDAISEAKRLAVSAEKPDECAAVTLQGYRVRFTPSLVGVVAVCPGGSPLEKVRNLATGRITQSPANITFSVLTGGAASDATIDICADSHLFRITVTKAGSVSEPLEIIGGC